MEDPSKIAVWLILLLKILLIRGQTNEPDWTNKTLSAFPSSFKAKFKAYGGDGLSATLWYNGDEKFLRLDGQGGAVKTFVEKVGENITQYSRFPFGIHKEYCLKSTEDQQADWSTYFINIAEYLQSSFKYIGKETFRGVETEKWCDETSKDQNYTIYMKYQQSSIDPNKQLLAPVFIIKNSKTYGNFSRVYEVTDFSDEIFDRKSLWKPFDDVPCVIRDRKTEWKDDFVASNEQKFGIPQILPENFDWRELGAVVERKDPCDFSSTWTCAAAAVMEGAYFLRTNRTKLVRLSRQYLIDCAASWHPQSEHKSRMEDKYAYEWVIQKGGLLEDQYPGPTTGLHEVCKVKDVNSSITISSWVRVTPSYDTHAMKTALINYGPISVYFKADKYPFLNIADEVYDDPSCGHRRFRLTYFAVVVGYGKKNNTEYWIVNPFWGPEYGQDGYLKIAMKNNTCDTSYYATFAI